VTERDSRDGRVLFLAATAKDGAVARARLSSLDIGLEPHRSLDALVREMALGAAAILLPEESVSSPHIGPLRAALAAQPPWSDIPVLILTRPGADSAASGEAMRTLGNVTLLERPVRFAAFVSAVRTAIRARERQYQIRQYLADRSVTEAALRAADQRKDEFLATLGHELRNPLSPLLTAVHLLKTGSPDASMAARVTAVMERQLSHLVRLVNDLLEVSRITRGLIEVRREPVDIAFVVHSAIDTTRPLLDAAGHELTIELPDTPLTVDGDPVRLTQVFGNLLANAAKYTNAGGHVAIRAVKAGDRAIVSVRDDGIGIAPDQLVSVFDMFTQVDRSHRRAQGGLGIGLTLVRSLVETHGGRVEARSGGAGTGSEFVVELPLAVDPARTPAETPGPRTFPPRRILIVDDNVDAAETLGELLGTLGAIVHVVDSGPAALVALDAFDPDAVLLDIGMPGMNGYEVAREIRSRPERAGLLLIAITGWGQDHDREQSMQAGFDHHVVKPPDVDRLRELLLTQ
jgi:signal transduction histidine kinase